MSAEPGGTIAVVGASARAAAFSLMRAGRQVIAADLFADADLARHCSVTRIGSYPEGFVDWLAQAECDCWLYTGALENHPAVVDEMAKIRPLWGAHGEGLRQVRDPLRLQAVLHQSGYCFPKTILASSRRPGGGPWLGKSYEGSSGSGVGLPAGARYRQRLISGISLSAVFHDDVLYGITRQLVGETWTGAAKFQYCGSVAPGRMSGSAERELRRLGELLCNTFHLAGWFGVDLIDDGNQWWVLEVNPRYTASVELVERALADPSRCYGKAILFAKHCLTISPKLSRYLLFQAGEFPWNQLADIPAGNTTIESGRPILTLYTSAASLSAVDAALRHRAVCLEQQLYTSGVTAC